MNNANFVVILWQDPYEYNARYAVLVGGPDADTNNERYWRSVLIANNALSYIGFTKIFNLFGNINGPLAIGFNVSSYRGIRIYGPACDYAFECVLLELINLATMNDLIYLQMAAHDGLIDATYTKNIILGNPIQVCCPYTPVHDVNIVEKHALLYSRLIINIDWCLSGQQLQLYQSITNRRILMTSAGKGEHDEAWQDMADDKKTAYIEHGTSMAYTGNILTASIGHDGFFTGLSTNSNIYTAFEYGSDSAKNNFVLEYIPTDPLKGWHYKTDTIGDDYSGSTPLLDDCNDGVLGQDFSSLSTSDATKDGWLAYHTYI